MAERLGTQLQSGGLEQSIHTGLLGSGLFGGASLDLNFAVTKNVGPLVSFTRASNATYIDSAGTLQTAAVDVPRFDHNPTTGESLGLLVEEQRTNLLLRSEEFDNASWSKVFATVSANQTTAPDGTSNADKLIGNATLDGHYVQQNISGAISGINYTSAVFAKASELSRFELLHAIGSTLYVQGYDLSNGTLLTRVTAGTTAATGGFIQAVGNGWYRCGITQTSDGTAGAVRCTLRSANTVAFDATSQGVFLWGAQLEAGSFPSSYIPTTAAAVTRSADVASITGTNFSSWYRQDEGTMFARYSFPQSPNTGGARVFVFSNSAATNSIWLRAQGGVNRVYDVTDASVSQATFNQGAYAAGVEYRAALATKANDFGFAENGGAPQSDSSGTMPSAVSAETDSLLLEDSPFNDFYILGYSEASSSGVGVDRLGIGVDAGGTAPGNVHIRRLTFFPQRLPNSTLVALTQ